MTQEQDSKELNTHLPNQPVDPPSTPAASAQTSASEHSESMSQANSAPEHPTTQDHTSSRLTPNPSSPNKGRTKLIVLLVLIVLLGFIAFGLWKAYQPKSIELQGRVEAETLHVSTKVPSRIEEIYVRDGQQIQKGQSLVRLSSPEIEAKKQQALASLQSALALQSTAQRGAQQENIESLYANWQSLKAQQALAESTYQRGANLYKEGVISRQRRDEMYTAAVSAKEMASSAYQQYARAQRGSTPQQMSSADAQVKIAQAAVDEANALSAETQLLAPINGTVSKVYGKVSELIATGVPVASIIQDNDISVSLNIREDQYAQIYQSKTLQGFIPALNQSAVFKINHIDAEGEFATIKSTRQTGGYDIRSFKVHLVPVQPIPALKVGMSVLFKVDAST